MDEQIDFALLLIPVEPYITKALPRIHKALQNFRDNERLKYMPRRGPVAQLLRRYPSRKMTNKARVHEEYLWGLGQTLIDIRPKGLDNPNDVRRLQNREPSLYRLTVDINGVSNIGGIQQLPRSRCARDHKAVELRLILHVYKIANIAFEICGNVVGIIGVPIDILVLQFGHRTPMDDVPNISRRHLRC